MELSIRQVGPEDLPAAVRLLEIRDGRSYDAQIVAHLLGGFRPERSLAWMAFDDAEPVGLTMMFVRELDLDGQRVRAGYWAKLYVRPEYGDRMLYPRLTLAMTGALCKNRLAFLYAGIRRPQVAQAHIRLGFTKLGELVVRAKPLRPLRLLLRYKGWRGCEPLAGGPDLLYRGVLGLRRPARTMSPQEYEMNPGSTLAEFAALLNLNRCRVRQLWDASRLEERYAHNLEGEPYSLLGVRRQGALVAAALWRSAVRGHGVRAGVVMDLTFRAGEENAAREVLAAAERLALRDGCDTMLYLDGLAESNGVVDAARYWSSPERYAILLWPRKAAENGLLADLGNWRYAFGDHDAF